MDADLKKKWMTALRSGKYEQGRLVLRNLDNEFCCLGVLCDIYDNQQWIQFGSSYFYQNRDSAPCFIPDEIAYKIGISSNEQNTLSNKNDVSHESLQEIADYIERNL